MAPNPAPQIALSCAVSDRPIAQDVAMALRAAGYRVAPIEMGPQQVAEHYGAAPAVLVIWSTASAASKWVAQEAKAALARNALVEISLQPVRGDAPPAPLAPIAFDGWDNQPEHPAMRELKRRLRPIIGAGRGRGMNLAQATPWALGVVVVTASAAAIGLSLATRAPAGAAQAADQPLRPIVSTGPINPDSANLPSAPAALPAGLPPGIAPAPGTALRRAGPIKTDAVLDAPLEAPAASSDRDRGYSREDIAEMKRRRQSRAKRDEADTTPDQRPVEGPPM